MRIIKNFGELEMSTPTLFQEKSIPVIKSGANVYCVAPQDSVKTTTLILTILQKLENRAMGNAPRAVALAEGNEDVLELHQAF